MEIEDLEKTIINMALLRGRRKRGKLVAKLLKIARYITENIEGEESGKIGKKKKEVRKNWWKPGRRIR